MPETKYPGPPQYATLPLLDAQRNGNYLHGRILGSTECEDNAVLLMEDTYCNVALMLAAPRTAWASIVDALVYDDHMRALILETLDRRQRDMDSE